ncbi:MAG: glycosyltransferase family 2 protein [Acidimicrobiales bacterium]|nr:glycosyltransferase family 2 protein [Acidimicrobiales bacterium]
MSEPRISVIVIFLNEERFLGEAIDSVRTQTFTDWELILVDDGSTDGSAAIARAAAADSPDTIRYVTHPGGENRGMSASRNRGLEVAAGELVAFLDGDDVWLPDKLMAQHQELERHADAAMTAGPLLRWLRWSGATDAEHHEDLMGVGPKKRGTHPFAGTVVEPPKLVPLILRNDYYNPTGALIRRKVLDQVGGFVDGFRGPHEDMVAMTKICLEFPVHISPEMHHLYRIHPDSYTQVASSLDEVNAARETFLDWAETYVNERSVSSRVISWALWRARMPLRHPRLGVVFDPERRRRLLITVGRICGRALLPVALRDRLRSWWRRRVAPPDIEVGR